ncbi:hypothetical protein C8F01DRAFT_1234730 [Mycena amicta]|nr:hypothetical protein C8F01DRAFT_1234730 [Mycena amicta]
MPPLAQAFGFWILDPGTQHSFTLPRLTVFFSIERPERFYVDVVSSSLPPTPHESSTYYLLQPQHVHHTTEGGNANLIMSNIHPEWGHLQAMPSKKKALYAYSSQYWVQNGSRTLVMLTLLPAPPPHPPQRIFPAIYDVTPLRRSARSSWPNTRYSRIDNDLKHAGTVRNEHLFRLLGRVSLVYKTFFKSDVFTVRDTFDAIFPLMDSQAARPCPRASPGRSFKTPARTHHFISRYLARCPSKPEHTASSDRGPCTNTDLLFSCPSPFLVARNSRADLDPFIRYVTAFPLNRITPRKGSIVLWTPCELLSGVSGL